MNSPTRSASPRRRTLAPLLAGTLTLLVTGVALLGFSVEPVAAVPIAAGPAAPLAPPVLTAPHPHAGAGPAISTSFNPPCYPVNTTVCVSISSANETDIIPPSNSFFATVEPNVSQDINLIVKSREQLDWNGAAKSGIKAPIALNVTAVTWGGDNYYSQYDGDVWHSDTQTWWQGPSKVTTNKSGYTWWYYVNITAKASNGAPNFLAGMTVTWWIELCHNNSNVYTFSEGPHLHYTLSQAWPYSPYPGSGQYVAGGGATFEDVNLTVTPISPNWNDSVNLVLNTTQADVLANATIGSAYVDLTEATSSGSLIQQGTLIFPVKVGASGFGSVSVGVVIPPSYSQVANAIVSYRLTVTDVPGDLLVTPTYSYTVGANGTFLSGIFLDDLNIATNPGIVLSQSPNGNVTPGQAVTLTLTSRNAGTAISAAAVYYTVSFPLLRESVTEVSAFKRTSSTIFIGHIPGLPIGAFVNFTIYAWDFTERLEASPQIGFLTPDFQSYLPTGIPQNSSFFYVLVYDNASHAWVSNASVEITGPGGFFNSVGNTTFGLYYPNETTGSYLPLLVPANTSYRITVTDHGFPSIAITVQALHQLGARQTLVQASNYAIVQEQNVFLFYLNSTPPAPTVSPPATGTVGGSSLNGVTLLAIFGVLGFGIASVFLNRWWKQIRDRRKAEEKRVTL